MILRTLVVDDEALGRERLCFLLSRQSEVQVVGECRNGGEAATYLARNEVDLLLVDIQMPVVGGFDLLSKLGNKAPLVVFTTAHNEYAPQAFDVHAVDYLTKPIEAGRLQLAIDRVRERLQARIAIRTQEALHRVLAELPSVKKVNYPKRLLVPNGGVDVFVDVEEIEWVEAADYYACLHVGKRTLLLRETMKELVDTLDPALFVRIHRSVIVNIAKVREVLREGRGDGTVLLRNGERLKMSKAGWNALLLAGEYQRS